MCPIFQRLRNPRQPHKGLVFTDESPPFDKLPTILDVAEDTNLVFDVTSESRENLSNVKYIGIRDSYYRQHWAKSGDIKRAVQNMNRYEKEKGVKIT